MPVETVFGVTQAGRPCRSCLRMGGYCHHHISQQPGRSVNTLRQPQQPVYVQSQPQQQRVFGYTQRGLPCKICLRKGDFCHYHLRQRGGNRVPAERVRNETPTTNQIHYGVTLQGLPCKTCIRKGGYCRHHEDQRPVESPPRTLPPSPPRESRRSPPQDARRASLQQENRRTAPDTSTRRSSRPARVHNEERQRQISGFLEGRTEPETRNSPRRRRLMPRQHTEIPQPNSTTTQVSNTPSNNTHRPAEPEARSSPRRRRHIPRQSVERPSSVHTINAGSPERRRRRSEGQPTLNMSNREMDEQFYRLLGLFSQYMQLVQQDEDERQRNGRPGSRSSQQARSSTHGFPESGSDSSIGGWEFPTDSQTGQSRISVGSLREAVNESIAAARRASAARTPPAISRFAAASQAPPTATTRTLPVVISPDESFSSSGSGRPECIICLEDLRKDGHYPEFLPCGHGFHCACLEQWRSYSNCCPLCRCPTASRGYGVARVD